MSIAIFIVTRPTTKAAEDYCGSDLGGYSADLSAFCEEHGIVDPWVYVRDEDDGDDDEAPLDDEDGDEDEEEEDGDDVGDDDDDEDGNTEDNDDKAPAGAGKPSGRWFAPRPAIAHLTEIRKLLLEEDEGRFPGVVIGDIDDIIAILRQLQKVGGWFALGMA